MFLAAMHNGISRLYETFGNGGADTEKRILDPDEYSRTWFKPNPPLPVVTWSQRDNNNYEQTALLSTLSFFAQNSQQFLENYYTKSKRSILKPKTPVRRLMSSMNPPRAAKPHCSTSSRSSMSRSAASPSPSPVAPPAKPEKPDSDNADKVPPIKTSRKSPRRPSRNPRRRQLRHPHGSALLPHRGRAARSSISGLPTTRRSTPMTTPAGPSVTFSRQDRSRHRPCHTKGQNGGRRRPAADLGKIAGSGSVYAVNNRRGFPPGPALHAEGRKDLRSR